MTNLLRLGCFFLQAVQYIEQGHVRVGPDTMTDPAFLVTRNMEDFVTWVDTSKLKRHVQAYNVRHAQALLRRDAFRSKVLNFGWCCCRTSWTTSTSWPEVDRRRAARRVGVAMGWEGVEWLGPGGLVVSPVSYIAFLSSKCQGSL